MVLHGDARRGGAERYTSHLAATLRQSQGIDVTVLAGRVADAWPADAGRAMPLGMAGRTRSGRYRSFLAGLRTHLESHRYDVVHAMLPVPRGLCDIYHPHAGVAARRTTSRLGWWSNPRRRLFASVERDLLADSRPPLVLALSGLVEAELKAAHPGLGSDHIRRLFNGVDLERFSPTTPPLDRWEFGCKADDTVALFVSNNFELKGLGPLLQALARVPQMRLVVVGRDDPTLFLRRARQLGIASRVHFAGGVSEAHRLYTMADLLVLPTRRDSCSLVVLEALASGLPVISTRTNGACEVMTDGRQGMILDRWDDVHALAGAMNRLLDPQTRSAMRAAAIELRPLLSWDGHVETLLGIYAGLESDS